MQEPQTIDFEDRLMHVLLQEQLGGDCAPDLSERVLIRSSQQRLRVIRIYGTAAAAAAVLVAASIIWGLLAFRYPSPQASGGVAVVGGGPLHRGAQVETADSPAQLVLGGYCQVDLAPGTKMSWGGTDKAEEVYLREGSITCDVKRQVGSFTVKTDSGEVCVQGTKFDVQVVRGPGDEQMLGKRMLVRVLAGAVVASTTWGTYNVKAGDDAIVLPEGGIVNGTVIQKGDGWIRVRNDAGTEYKFLPRRDAGTVVTDQPMVAQFNQLAIGGPVKVVWTMQDQRRILALTDLRANQGQILPAGHAPVADATKFPVADLRWGPLREAVLNAAWGGEYCIDFEHDRTAAMPMAMLDKATEDQGAKRMAALKAWMLREGIDAAVLGTGNDAQVHDLSALGMVVKTARVDLAELQVADVVAQLRDQAPDTAPSWVTMPVKPATVTGKSVYLIRTRDNGFGAVELQAADKGTLKLRYRMIVAAPKEPPPQTKPIARAAAPKAHEEEAQAFEPTALEQEQAIVTYSHYQDPYGLWRRGDSGRIFGPVTQKSADWIEVTPQDESPIRFTVPTGGGIGDIVTEQIRNTMVGEKIEVKFAFDQGQIMALNIVRAQ